MLTFQSAKVVLRGDGGAGKTTLLKAICGQPTVHLNATFVTEVIHVPVAAHPAARPLPSDDSSRQFVFWDTPGQGLEIDYQHAMRNCSAAVVVVKGEYFHGFERAEYYVQRLRRFCPSAPRILVALHSGRGLARFSPEQLASVAASSAFAAALDVSLDNPASLELLISTLAAHISWHDIPALSQRRHEIGKELLRVLDYEGAIPASRLDEVCSSLDVHPDELRDVVHGLCDTGEIVVAAESDTGSLYMTFQRWTREVERLDARARQSRARDGRISPGLMFAGVQSASTEALIEATVVSQLVSAGHYAWEGKDLIRGRARRLSQPVRCFVSHSSSEKAIAEVIVRLLRSRGIDVWLDDREIRPGDSIVSRIEEGIDSSSAVLALLSRAAVRSAWVQEELRMATYRKITDTNFRVIPVVVEECDIPAFLRGLARLDWRQEGENGILRLAEQLRHSAQRAET